MKAILFLLLTLSPVIAEQFNASQFQQHCLKTANEAEAKDQFVIKGSNGWYYLAKELRHLGVGQFWGENAIKVSRATKPKYADPLPAILDFNKSLQELGIHLIVVPVPPKVSIYPEGIGLSTEGRLDSINATFITLLKNKGVDVIDLAPIFLAKKSDTGAPLYCKTDSHWSGEGCSIAADHISEKLIQQDWLSKMHRRVFKKNVKQVKITGDLVTDLKGAPQEILQLGFVTDEKDALVEPRDESPIILLGDSHTLVFHSGQDMHATGAGLPDLLASKLGIEVALIGVRGSGATPARINLYRKARSDPDYLKGKKALIWCFSAREFTESLGGWRIVPVVKK
jgi:alginate O-acetyltransferase complex protein AlgJ